MKEQEKIMLLAITNDGDDSKIPSWILHTCIVRLMNEVLQIIPPIKTKQNKNKRSQVGILVALFSKTFACLCAFWGPAERSLHSLFLCSVLTKAIHEDGILSAGA